MVLPSTLLLLVLLVKFTVTSAFLLTSNFTALVLAVFIMSFMGQAGVVNTMVKETLLSLISTSCIMFNVTRSLPKSGSSTLLSAFNISSLVIVQLFVKKLLWW